MSSGNHVAIVTGGAQGIGLATSAAFLKDGYRVCISDTNEERGKQSVASLRKLYGEDHVTFYTCDVSSEQQVQDLFESTTKKFGRVDVLVNNAGIINEQDAKLSLDVNVLGPINGCQMALKYMNKSKGGSGGIVVNVASALGLLPFFKLPVYSATKHAVVGLTRCFGNEYYLKSSGILFMAICPYYVRTGILESGRSRDDVEGIVPSESFELMEPEVIAGGILKLLQEKKNGSCLAVFSGEYIYVGLPEELKDISIR